MKTLYVVRHGVTSENEQRIYSPEDAALSKEGQTQALTLQKRLAGIPLEIVYTSPLLRAKMTTQIVNKVLQLPIEEDSLLVEWKKPTSLIGKSIHGEEDKKFKKAEFANRYDIDWKWEDGESIKEAKGRIERFFSKMKTISQKSVLVVTHSFTLKMMLFEVLLGKDELNPNSQILKNASIKNTGITIFRLQDDTEDWQLLTWNDHAHLVEPL